MFPFASISLKTGNDFSNNRQKYVHFINSNEQENNLKSNMIVIYLWALRASITTLWNLAILSEINVYLLW